jgi:uncharacterized protein Yka (UPF0111/DUF47 family)
MPSAGRHILARLHDLRIQIELRMLRDPSFRSLCEDYDAAVDALEHWKQSSSMEAAERTSEYESLADDLQKEILQEIGSASTGS